MSGNVTVWGVQSDGTPTKLLVNSLGQVLMQEVPGSTFNHGNQTTNAGARVTLAATQTIRSVLVTAKVGNTGYVYLGGSTVSSASYGKRLAAGEGVTIAVNNLNLVYFDVSVNGEGVDFLYVN